jgi:[protein-PII] uridylyltransferase
MASGTLRSQRDQLLEHPELKGTEFCRALSDVTDGCLADHAATAAGGSSRKIALVAVGGYGRRELCPHSDLDLLLIHEGRRDIKEVAEALWYPLWDQGIKVDHAVRRPKEVLRVAQDDLRVALGLLDARVIWGDPKVAVPVIEKVRGLWESKLATKFLPALEEQMAERHLEEGDVAFLLEPNLKEAHGGLRDVNVLQALGTCAPRLGELVDLAGLARSAATLLSVRVELHRLSGRALDRMLLQEQDAVAAALGYDDADALCRVVSEAGRSIARISDETWRRRRLWAPGSSSFDAPKEERRSVEPGIVLVGDEVTLDASAGVESDPSLPWRLAAVAAERDLPLALGAIHRLAELSPIPADPWSPETREALVRLLLAGHRAIPAFESLDHQGLVVRQLPEWEHVRHHHQRNAYHRFTVDRHLLETAANAADQADTVRRTDLLVLGALLHDIGKGLPGDHTQVGIEIVGTLGPRLGLPPKDVATLQAMVRHHLLLADTATRRDLSDPLTIATVAEAVGDVDTLLLLAALTRADSMATGPSAWGSWKDQLITELVDRTVSFLQGIEQTGGPAEEAGDFTDLLDKARQSAGAAVVVDPPSVVVAAPDRPGLLSEVAGVLALHGLSIRSADVDSRDGIALDTFSVDMLLGRWPTAEELQADLDAVIAGTADLAEMLRQRAETYAGSRRTLSAHPVIPSITVDVEGSSHSTILEVHAIDEIGLLHRLTAALFAAGLNVVAARVSTIGIEVVDAFYVRSPSGNKQLDPGSTESVTRVLAEIIGAGRPS